MAPLSWSSVPSSKKRAGSNERFAKQATQAVETFVDKELAGDP
jgi:hypothetical protein